MLDRTSPKWSSPVAGQSPPADGITRAQVQLQQLNPQTAKILIKSGPRYR